MWLSLIVFILASFIGFIPGILDIRTDGKLNWKGITFISFFSTFLILGILLIIFQESENKKKEARYNEDRRNDSIQNQLQRNDIQSLTENVTLYRKSDSTFKLALKKGNYKYDSNKALIISPKTYIQSVENGGRAIQNNSPNQGIQNLGDGNIYLNARKELTEKGLQLVVSEINKYGKEWNVRCCEVSMHSEGNGDIVFRQILKMFEDKGISVDINYELNNMELPPNGIHYGIKNGKLSILVGDY